MYLETPTKGGATIFPALDVKIEARKGLAVLFYSLDPSGVEDVNSLHGGMPVEEGTKWCLTKWIRIMHHHNRNPLGDTN